MSNPRERLHQLFVAATEGSRIGGSSVLCDVAAQARVCIIDADASIAAVAFALSTVLEAHAEDLEGRAVTADDAYALAALAYDAFADAVRFVRSGGSSEVAVKIIVALARLTPSELQKNLGPK